ncbi:hypothetical protein J7L48_05565, partial [bacterium]|nr:hypothetical protein [bacterium]
NTLLIVKNVRKLKNKSSRKSLSPILSSYKDHKISLDVSFSLKYFEKYDRLIKKMNNENIFIAYYGHFGDGIFHTNICYDKSSKSIDFIVKKIYNFINEVDGAISGEHGYGVYKRKYIAKEMKDKLIYIRGIKKIFDPKNILNRGLEL